VGVRTFGLRHLIEIMVVGGRDGTRTRDPLLANWGEGSARKIQVVVWAALSSSSTRTDPFISIRQGQL
jgi:hypothetical protein